VSARAASTGAATGPGAGVDAREQAVLDAMEARLTRTGIRSVVMSDLASELGMSTKTLYRIFPSKDALVSAVVDRWIERLVDAQAWLQRSDMSAQERVRTAAHFLVERRSRFCDDFWADLQADHPDAWRRHQVMMADARRRSLERTARAMRPGLDPYFARSLLAAMIERALQPETLAASGLSRSQAIDATVEIWCGGAFVGPDASPPAS
jgi:AcrR family transcriptional regulator